jgi:pyruvate/2-oxoglutarate dehydrogenase complex dihydrolipoamide acyltransferase (E2) component
MPDLSAISATVKVVRWLVGVGEPVRRGQDLLEVETDKSTMVVESALDGVLKATLAEPGREVPSGASIATFEVERASAPAPTRPTPDAPPAPGPPTGRPPASSGAPGGSFFARNRREARPGPAAGDGPSGGGDA